MPGPSVSEIRAKWKELGLWDAFQEMATDSEREYGPDRDDYLKRKKRRERAIGILRTLFWALVSSLISLLLKKLI